MDFEEIAAQAKNMQDHLQAMQNNLARVPVSGQDVGGLVTVTLNGAGQFLDIKISPDIVPASCAKTLRRVILEAANNANEAKEGMIRRETALMMEGLGLPGKRS